MRANQTLCDWLRTPSQTLTRLRLVDLLSVGSRFLVETNLWPLLKLGGHIREAAVDLLLQGQRLPVLMAGNRNGPSGNLELVYRIAFFPAAHRRQFELDLLAARKAAEDAAAQLEVRLMELGAAQTALALQNSELAEAVHEKNKLLGMAAHDLRSPLGAIEALCRFIAEDEHSRLSAEATRFLNLISHSSHYMQTLVSNLLDYTKVQSGTVRLELQDTDVFDLAMESARMNGLLSAKRKIKINVRLLRNVAATRAWVDPAKIKQVFDNLIANAVKVSTPGRAVDVIVEGRSADVLVTVCDQGASLCQAEQTQPFDAFGFAGADDEPSAGLGLAIAQKIVSEHGGYIDVTSRAGVGSQFIVQLPRHSADAS